MKRSFHERPILRGHLHQAAFFTALGACILLVLKSTHSITLIASLIFSFGLLFLLATSALYHRKYWNPKQYAVMKQIDHSAIYFVIAGTFTPVCLLALPEKAGTLLLAVVWGTAVIGVLKTIFWTTAPKPLTAIVYVIMGWLVLPYLGDLKNSLGWTQLFLLAAGGAAYTLGAIFYALRKPNLFPQVFEHHELFHLLTIIGAAFHFSVVYQLIF